MSLEQKIQLCHINIEYLWQWIKENCLLAQDFALEKKKWAQEINQQPNFFSDTELLLIYQDILILKTLNDSQTSFLAKTYRLEYQSICQKLFQERKNIIIISDRQWKIGDNSEKLKEEKNNEKVIILFKDRESIEKNLGNWLKEASV